MWGKIALPRVYQNKNSLSHLYGGKNCSCVYFSVPCLSIWPLKHRFIIIVNFCFLHLFFLILSFVFSPFSFLFLFLWNPLLSQPWGKKLYPGRSSFHFRRRAKLLKGCWRLERGCLWAGREDGGCRGREGGREHSDVWFQGGGGVPHSPPCSL